MAAPPVPPPAIPTPLPPAPVPWYPPPPRSDQSKIVLIVVLVVAIAVIVPIILAAVLYVMVGGLLEGPGTQPPAFFGSPQSCGTGCTQLDILASPRALPLADYRVTFSVENGTLGASAILGPGPVVQLGGRTLTFTDLSGNRILTTDDFFRVESTEAPTNCEISLRVTAENSEVSSGFPC